MRDRKKPQTKAEIEVRAAIDIAFRVGQEAMAEAKAREDEDDRYRWEIVLSHLMRASVDMSIVGIDPLKDN